MQKVKIVIEGEVSAPKNWGNEEIKKYLLNCDAKIDNEEISIKNISISDIDNEE